MSIDLSGYENSIDLVMRLLQSQEDLNVADMNDLELYSTLKGAVFLLLYNAVEATVKQSFLTLFEQIHIEQLPGLELTDPLLSQWFQQACRKTSSFDCSPKIYFGVSQELAQLLVQRKPLRFDYRKLPELGTLDANRITRMVIDFGIPLVQLKGIHERQKEVMRSVREARNLLAHGDKTFSECGRDYTVAEIVGIKDHVFDFLRCLISDLSDFVQAGSFRRPSGNN